MKPFEIVLKAGLLLLIFQGIMATALADESGVLLNLMVDMEQSPQAEGKPPAVGRMLEVNSTINLTNVMDPMGLNFTIFVTGELADQGYPLYVTLLGSKPNHELAVAGMSTGETLVPLSDQEIRLRRAKRFVENDYICGGEQFKVVGYKPQPDSIDPSTYQILDDQGFKYLVDESGLADSSGSQPYQMTDHSFYVVPVSRSDDMILSDKFAKQQNLNATQWNDLLVKAFEDAKSSNEPLSVVFTNTISGSGDYLDACSKFVEYSTTNGAQFLTAAELVDKAQAEPS